MSAGLSDGLSCRCIKREMAKYHVLVASAEVPLIKTISNGGTATNTVKIARAPAALTKEARITSSGTAV